MVLAYETIRSSGFTDDVSDSVRTMDSMDLASIHYIDEVLPKMDNYPIQIADGEACIEIVFDVILTYSDDKQIRYVGTLDALTYNVAKKHYCVEDNKTASRLDTGWKAQFILSHQVTGYMTAASIVFEQPITHSRILGLKIRPTNRGDDIYNTTVTRTPEDMQRWALWMRNTVDVFEKFKDNWEAAPRFTHSCNRYFRPCSLLAFCADSYEGRLQQWDQMVPATLSPSEEAVQE